MIGRVLGLALACVFLSTGQASAYGVLAHETIVDAAWDSSIVPLLQSRFHPTAAELRRAHAFAYGGALIQDIGYYPLSSRVFGDLTHYVRSGDFVVALLEEARTVDEYAFAIGALSHYVADNDGHPIAVNRAVPLIYPKLEAKYGPEVTFEEDPAAHLKTEFGLDVVQVAQGHYRPDAYRDFIGFEVSRPVLERAFLRTYGLRFNEVFADLDLSIGTFRRTVSTLVPSMTKVAWEMKGSEIARRDPAVTTDRFLFALSRSEYEQRWGRQYDRPNIGEKFVAVLLRVVPKVGPFKVLAFKPPTPEAERLFLRSLTISIDRYRAALSTLSRHRLALNNLNLDIGQPVQAGDYRLADETYARWLDRLAHDHFEGVSPEIRSNLLAFYKSVGALADANPRRSAWKRALRELDELKTGTAASR